MTTIRACSVPLHQGRAAGAAKCMPQRGQGGSHGRLKDYWELHRGRRIRADSRAFQPHFRIGQQQPGRRNVCGNAGSWRPGAHGYFLRLHARHAITKRGHANDADGKRARHTCVALEIHH